MNNEQTENKNPETKGDIDDFIFEGNCTLRHSER